MSDTDRASSLLSSPHMAWIGLVMGLTATGACYLATGPTLGFFFGSILFATLLVPSLCATEDRCIHRLLIAGGVTDGIALVWLFVAFNSSVTIVQASLCYLLLISWCFALVGLSDVLREIFRSFIPVSAMTMTTALLWLTWPIWLARLLPSHPAIVEWLTPVHPLLSMNGALRNLGVWSEQRIAYTHLINLGQDIPYNLPHSILPAGVAYLLMGALGTLAGWTLRRNKPSIDKV